jgi:hypothetical protein
MDRFIYRLACVVYIEGSCSKWAMESISSSQFSIGPGHQEVDVSIPFNFKVAMLIHIANIMFEIKLHNLIIAA